MIKISKFFKKSNKHAGHGRRNRLALTPNAANDLRLSTIPEHNELPVTPSEHHISVEASSYYSSPSFEQSELKSILKEVYDELESSSSTETKSSTMSAVPQQRKLKAGKPKVVSLGEKRDSESNSPSDSSDEDFLEIGVDEEELVD